MNPYGHFSEDRMEFIITRPDTPAPWINYISNRNYSGLISHTAGGYSFYKSPRDSRITRWRYNSLPWDRPGRYLYIRDKDSSEFWSPTWQPTKTNLENFECRHGLYYTKISSQYKNIYCSIFYFVPSDDLEIWWVKVKNHSPSKKVLDIFAYVELCLGHALLDLINQPNDQHFNEVKFDKNHQILLSTKRYWVKSSTTSVKQANEAWDKYVFMSTSLPVKGWDGSKEQFIGRWRSEENPIAVENGKCLNTEITAGDAVNALQTELTLEAKAEKEFVILLGVVPKKRYRQSSLKLVKKYRHLSTVKKEFLKLRKNWQDYLSYLQVETPDIDLNTMINVWNQYQTSVTFLFSRDASYYHGGLMFGRGYRDSCQDLMGPLIPRPEWARSRILEMCQFQFKDGSTFHLYFPLSGGGEKTGHSDTPLWLPLSIIAYVKETGDFNFLKDNVPFYDGSKVSVLEHLFMAIEYTLQNLTKRYLAKFGPGDWNDTLDYLGRGGKGESVWVSMFLAYILKETIMLCDFLNDVQHSRRYRDAYQKISQAINRLCWDGKWYIRGTNDQRQVIGSHVNKEGKIFLNTQSWAVLSGIAQKERAYLCMDAVRTHLETPKGPKILHPPYKKIDPTIGLATRCVPGKKENGAVFNHPVSWSILAECLLGRGDRAYEIYKKALPMNPVIDIDRYQVEPYVYAEYVTSPDHPTFGQASHSWLTGSSTWMLKGAVEYILGIRPIFQGIMIDPCIPKKWTSFKVTRKFRGKIFEFQIENPHHISKGVKEVFIENEKLNGQIIDFSDPKIRKSVQKKTRLKVKVIMG